MEVRNNTPSFGMAFRKPSPKVMEAIEAQVAPRQFKAFLKEQAKVKNFDIVADVNAGGNPYVRVVEKEGLNTYGYQAPNIIYNINGEESVLDIYEKELSKKSKEFRKNHEKLCLYKPIRMLIGMKEITKYVMKCLYDMAFRPAKLVPQGLRDAGDIAIALDNAVESRAKNIKQYSDLM